MAVLPDGAIRVERPGSTRFDGGSYRKEGLIRHLREAGPGPFHELTLPAGSGRVRGAMARLAALLRFCAETPSRSVVLFYPETPFFLPPGTWKLGPAEALLSLATGLLRRRGVRVVLDVEDLPFSQHATLSGQSHPAGDRCLHRIEGRLGSLVDEIWIPTESLAARWLARHGSSNTPSIRIVPTGSVEPEERPAPRQPGRGAYLMAGSLWQSQDRGQLALVREFLRAAPAASRLHLAGAGGDWLRDLSGDGRVIHHGPLGAGDLARLTSRCEWGLIPYPERGYFHEVFPAKLAFYASLGLPALSTALRETSRALVSGKAGTVLPREEWREFFDHMPEPERTDSPSPWLWSRILPPQDPVDAV